MDSAILFLGTYPMGILAMCEMTQAWNYTLLHCSMSKTWKQTKCLLIGMLVKWTMVDLLNLIVGNCKKRWECSKSVNIQNNCQHVSLSGKRHGGERVFIVFYPLVLNKEDRKRKENMQTHTHSNPILGD